MKAILERKSIRKYKEEKVPMENINELLKAAMQAPSAGNSQPWEFIVVDDKEIHKGYWPQDCAAAVENILIKAQDMELGAVWLGVYPEEDRYDENKIHYNTYKKVRTRY